MDDDTPPRRAPAAPGSPPPPTWRQRFVAWLHEPVPVEPPPRPPDPLTRAIRAFEATLEYPRRSRKGRL